MGRILILCKLTNTHEPSTQLRLETRTRHPQESLSLSQSLPLSLTEPSILKVLSFVCFELCTHTEAHGVFFCVWLVLHNIVFVKLIPMLSMTGAASFSLLGTIHCTNTSDVFIHSTPEKSHTFAFILISVFWD